jgi:Ras GTPase-activating-like protein IQGAP2/3
LDRGLLRDCWLIVCAAQKILRELKAKISSQSKKNFVLEKDVRYLDSRIALLIQNRMALEEVGRIHFN